MNHAHESAPWIEQAIGPRQVGGTYRSHHWGTDYEVIAIVRRTDHESTGWHITVRDLPNGPIRTHCTPWHDHDQVLTQPNPQERHAVTSRSVDDFTSTVDGAAAHARLTADEPLAMPATRDELDAAGSPIFDALTAERAGLGDGAA